MPESNQTALAECDDAALMTRIGARRDREAFAVLFERHQHAAYSMARYMARATGQAEEAFQEAMLRVWTAAPQWRQEGSVRNWILKIVVRESLRLNRSQQRERSRRMRKVELEGVLDTKEAAPSRPQEDSELLGALRASLDRLDESNRQMLALYFGAGMSQEEIGESLEVPQTTVSRRIQQLLKMLKVELSKSGCAVAIPLLTKEGLCRALCEGSLAPPELRAKVLSNLGREAARMSRRVVQAQSSGYGTALGICVAVAVAGVALVAILPNRSTDPTPAAVALAAETPPLADMVYQDHFESPKLDAFWEVSEGAEWTARGVDEVTGEAIWQPRGAVRTAQGTLQSRLELSAWGQTWKGEAASLVGKTPEAAGDAAAAPGAAAEAFVFSRPFAMGSLLHLSLDAYPPEGGGRFAYGFEIFDTKGVRVYGTGYSAERLANGTYVLTDYTVVIGQPQTTRLGTRTVSQPESLSLSGGMEIQPAGAVDGNAISEERINSVETPMVRIRFFVSAEPGGWVRWPIDRLELRRRPIEEPAFKNTWDFGAGPAADLPKNPDLWTWMRPDQDQPGFMRATPIKKGDFVILRLPGDAPRAAFKIDVRARIPKLGRKDNYEGGVDAFWIEADTPPSQTYWTNALSMKLNRWQTLRFIFNDCFVFTYVDGDLYCIRSATLNFPSRRIFLGMRGMDIQSIKTTRLSKDDLPKAVRDPITEIQRMKNGPFKGTTTPFLKYPDVMEE